MQIKIEKLGEKSGEFHNKISFLRISQPIYDHVDAILKISLWCLTEDIDNKIISDITKKAILINQVELLQSRLSLLAPHLLSFNLCKFQL